MTNRPLRIAQFVSHYPYQHQTPEYFAGGTGEVARGLARALAARGHEVRVHALSMDRNPHVETDGAVAIHRSGASWRVAQANLSLSSLWDPLRFEADIVHVHAGNPPAPLAGLLYAQRHHVPFVVTYHGDPQAQYGSLPRRVGVAGWTLALRRLLQRADCLICPSGPFVHSSRLLASHAFRVVDVPNGITADELAWPETPAQAKTGLGLPATAKVILFLGALSPYKAPDLVMRAAMPLLALYADAWLVIAGSGVMEPALRSMAAASGVGDRIRLVGFVTGDLKRRVYRAADLFVLPSVMTTEVFPMVLLEASTFGLPLIVSDLPTFEALVAHEQNGLVAARGDQDALTRTFARLIADEPLRHALGREAQRRVAAYDWRRLAEQHESLYLDAISRRRAGERPRRS